MKKRKKRKSELFFTVIARTLYQRLDQNTYYSSQSSAVCRSSISDLNLYLIIDNSLLTTDQIRLFLKKSVENLTENRSGNPVIYDSMRLHLLFPTAKTAALYLVSIKTYSKNTHRPFYKMSVHQGGKSETPKLEYSEVQTEYN